MRYRIIIKDNSAPYQLGSFRRACNAECVCRRLPLPAYVQDSLTDQTQFTNERSDVQPAASGQQVGRG